MTDIDLKRGYFEIGIYQPLHWENVGTLWRSAWQLGAAGIFMIGRKFDRQGSDLWHVDRRIPFRRYDSFDDFYANRPVGARLIGVEFGGSPLSAFIHPPTALYLLGSESNGLPPRILDRCDHVIEIESVNAMSYNVAVSGSLVMYAREIQLRANRDASS